MSKKPRRTVTPATAGNVPASGKGEAKADQL